MLIKNSLIVFFIFLQTKLYYCLGKMERYSYFLSDKEECWLSILLLGMPFVIDTYLDNIDSYTIKKRAKLKTPKIYKFIIFLYLLLVFGKKQALILIKLNESNIYDSLYLQVNSIARHIYFQHFSNKLGGGRVFLSLLKLLTIEDLEKITVRENFDSDGFSGYLFEGDPILLTRENLLYLSEKNFKIIFINIELNLLYLENNEIIFFIPIVISDYLERLYDRLYSKIPSICFKCQNLHGQLIRHTVLVCAIHPYGHEENSCPDFSPNKLFTHKKY